MFLHGIPFIYLTQQSPLLDPAKQKGKKSKAQQTDAQKLIQLIGFEPVHLLRSSSNYPLRICIEECLRYGDTVFSFLDLPYPRVQLSPHEWGVKSLSLLDASWVLTTRPSARRWLRQRFPLLPIFFRRGLTQRIVGNRRLKNPHKKRKEWVFKNYPDLAR